MENERYLRQKKLGKWNQEKLANSTISIIGLGALGTTIGTSLVMMGIGTLNLVDFDEIEVSNLSKQLLYSEEDVGKKKTTVCAEKWKKINSTVTINTYESRVENLPNDVLSSSSIIIEGLDRVEPRRWLNAFCIDNHIPFISGGVYGFWGNVQVIIPNETPCFECQPMLPEEELSKACTPFGKTRKKSLEQNDEENSIPTISSVSMVIGGFMANEAIKLLMNIPVLKNYAFWDLKNDSFTKLKLKRSEECFVCSNEYVIKAIPIEIDINNSIFDLVDQIRYSFNLKSEIILTDGIEVKLVDSSKIANSFDIHNPFYVITDEIPRPLKFKIKNSPVN